MGYRATNPTKARYPFLKEHDCVEKRLYNVVNPKGKNALHDIHLRFNVNDIWSALSMLSFIIDSISKDIRLPVWDIRDLSLKTTVHRTNTVSVVGGSYYPIAVDINGLIRLSNALTTIEERTSNLIQEYPRKSLAYAVKEKLNSTSTSTTLYHRLPNRPQYELEE